MRSVVALRLVVLLAGSLSVCAPLLAATITVNSTADASANDGACTLREAIIAANTNAVSGGAAGECAAGSTVAPDSIIFNITGGGPHTIAVTGSPLPPIQSTAASTLTIDGFTQSGAVANSAVTGNNAVYRIRLNGAGLVAPAKGLELRGVGTIGGGNTIRGLVIVNFPSEGIAVNTPSNTIVGNFIGIDTDGVTAGGNGTTSRPGIVVEPGDPDGDTTDTSDASGNIIGGSNPADRNVVSNNRGGGNIAIQDFNSYVDAFRADNTIVRGNYIGTNAAGTASAGAVFAAGIRVQIPDNTVIGGTVGTTPGGACTGSCNLISGQPGGGIFVLGDSPGLAVNTTIQGNMIGLDVTGSVSIGNGNNQSGIVVGQAATSVLIGGTSAAARNVISGHVANGRGITLEQSGTAGISTVTGNFIGTNSAGTAARANGGGGLQVRGFDGTVIGGTAAGAGNVISGNGNYGVFLGDVSNTSVQGNFIGVAANGTTALGNTAAGIRIQDDAGSVSTNNTIGAATSGGAGGNVIANNGAAIVNGGGVVITFGDHVNNRISTNSMYLNNGTTTGLGIDLSSDGVTANDNCDPDTGANNLQNFPVLTSAATNATQTIVSGSLDSIAAATYTIEFFSNLPGEDEGRTFLGSTSVTTDAGCVKGFVAVLGTVVPVGNLVTATAISATGNTSEFSAGVAATAPPLSGTKSFSVNPVAKNTTTRLTITINNPGSTAATNLSVTDNYPALVLNAAIPNASTTCSGGSLTAAAGGASVSMAGATLAGGGSCTIGVDVVGTAAGDYLNEILAGQVSSATVPSNTAIISSTLTVLFPPGQSKNFTPTTILAGGTSTLRVSLGNSNASVAITGVQFTDNYVAGLVNATPLVLTNTCGGTATATAGGTSLALTGGTIPAGGTCFVEVDVTSATPGDYANTLGVGSVVSTNAGANEFPASVSLEVLATPAISKSFGTDPIAPGGTSLLTITLTNANDSSMTGVSFTDTYPGTITNSAAPAGGTSCGGSVSAAANGTFVSLTGGTIPANSSCVVTVTVTSTTVGTHTNTIPAGAVASTSMGSNGTPASDTLTVNGPPVVTKAFTPVSISTGGVSTLTITLTNPNAVSVTGVSFTDTYPAAIDNATPTNAATTCGGSVTGAAGGGSVALTGGTIAASSSCTVTIDVTSTTVGTHANTIGAGAVTTTNTGPSASSADASLTVSALNPPTVTKAFTPSSILTGQISTLTITLSNSNGTAISGVSFTDTYPSPIDNAAVPNAATTCGGVVSAAAGGGTVGLAGGTIPANSSCTVTVDVTSSTAGTHTNTMPANSVSTTNAGTNGTDVSANLSVTALNPPAVAKSFAPQTISTGQTSTLTITLSNSNGTAISGLTFTDTYPAAIDNAAAPNAATTCGGVVNATAGGGTVSLSGGAIPANSSCVVTVDVTSSTTGTHTNTIAAGTIATTNAGSNANPASSNLTVTALLAPTAAKSFNPTTVGPGQTSTLTITLSNSNATAITGVAFTDNYPSQIANASTPNGASTCGGTVTATAGGSSLALTGGVIPANGSCNVSVSVVLVGGASGTNTIPAGGITAANAPASGTAASAQLGAVNAIPALSPAALAFLTLLLGLSAVFVMKR